METFPVDRVLVYFGKINVKSFELHLDSNIGSPEGKVLCVHVSFLISHFHAPLLASYSFLHLCLSCQLRNAGGRGRPPPHRLPPDFSSQCLIHSPLLTRATLSRPALGSLGTEAGDGLSYVEHTGRKKRPHVVWAGL